MIEQPQIPPAWRQLDFTTLKGVLLVVGATDTGKSTFCRYLSDHLQQLGRRPALLDGDPGQSNLGPPTTMTVTMAASDRETGRFTRRWFVGSTSPTRHLLPLVSGGARLTAAAFQAGATDLIYDTTGLIDPARGGLNLKLAKLDLLRPTTILAFQRQRELEGFLAPLRRSRSLRIIELPIAPAARRRDQTERRRNRARRFAAYFAGTRPTSFSWAGLPVLPAPIFTDHLLFSFSDSEGFCGGLGLVTGPQPGPQQIVVRTPFQQPGQAAALRLGDLQLDPVNYTDRHFSARN